MVDFLGAKMKKPARSVQVSGIGAVTIAR